MSKDEPVFVWSRRAMNYKLNPYHPVGCSLIMLILVVGFGALIYLLGNA